MQFRVMRRVTCALAVAFLCSILAACGGSAGTPAGPGASTTTSSTGAATTSSTGATTTTTTVSTAATTTTTLAGGPSANSAVASFNPAGGLTLHLEDSQKVTLAFTSSDSNPLTNLTITAGLATLPQGWTSIGNTLTCATVRSGIPCELTLIYTPTAVTPASTLNLDYAYVDSTGANRTGTASLSYRTAAPAMAYIPNENSHSVTLCTVNADGSLSGCKDAGIPLALMFKPQKVVIHGATAYIANLSNTVIQCAIGADGTFSGCKDSGAGDTNRPGGMALYGTLVYFSNAGNNTLSWCSINAGGGLAGCSNHGHWIFQNPLDLAMVNGKAYMANSASNVVSVCGFKSDGTVASCANSGATLLATPESLGISGTTAYISNYGSRGTSNAVVKCDIAADGSMSGCTGAATWAWTSAIQDIVVYGTVAYLVTSSDNAIMRCTVAADGQLTACTDAGATLLTYPRSITLY